MICPRCQKEQPVGINFCGNCGADLRAVAQDVEPQQDPWVGKVVDGRYRVLDVAGRGGMGSVYRVEHLRMGKIAAMKVMHGALSADRELAARFRREAEAVSRLNQPHTVQVFDFGEHEGAMYLIMEFVRGESLGRILRRDGPMSFMRSGMIVSQVCESLAEAHEQGIIHRDIKPENILITPSRDREDFVKVLDFGLALVRDAKEIEITQRGSLVGTPYYMSPEQIKGEPLDARSDLYSLGAVLYRVLTGENPFTAASPLGVLTKHMTEAPTPPRMKRPELPQEADDIVLRAMQKRREERYSSAEEMRADILRSLRIGDATPSRPIVLDDSTAGTQQRLSREDIENFERAFVRARRLRMAAVLGGILLVGALIVWWSLRRQTVAFPDTEIEPNNEPAEATSLESGHEVVGHVGKRYSREESDRDWYRFRVTEAGTSVLQARISAVPNMDLKLEVYGTDSNRIASVNNNGLGQGEVLTNLGLTAGTYYLLVREVWIAGQAPTENMSDPYKLMASWHGATPADEIEPNDAPNAAQPLRTDVGLVGTLGSADDVDFFVAQGAGGGLLAGDVTPPDGVDVMVELIRPRPADGAASGSLFDRGAAGEPERFSGIPWPDGGEGPIFAIKRKPAPAEAAAAPANTDQPYRLTIRLQ